MDPLSIAASVAGLVTLATKSIEGVRKLARLADAKGPKRALASLTTECSAIKTALIFLYVAVNGEPDSLAACVAGAATGPAADCIDVALTGCALAFARLDGELKELLGAAAAVRGDDKGEGLGWSERLRLAWHEDDITSILDQIRGLQGAVQLVLTVVQMQSTKAILDLLRERQPIIQSIRRSISVRSSIADAAVLSEGASRSASILTRVSIFSGSSTEGISELDKNLLQSRVYQKLLHGVLRRTSSMLHPASSLADTSSALPPSSARTSFARSDNERLHLNEDVSLDNEPLINLSDEVELALRIDSAPLSIRSDLLELFGTDDIADKDAMSLALGPNNVWEPSQRTRRTTKSTNLADDENFRHFVESSSSDSDSDYIRLEEERSIANKDLWHTQPALPSIQTRWVDSGVKKGALKPDPLDTQKSPNRPLKLTQARLSAPFMQNVSLPDYWPSDANKKGRDVSVGVLPRTPSSLSPKDSDIPDSDCRDHTNPGLSFQSIADEKHTVSASSSAPGTPEPSDSATASPLTPVSPSSLADSVAPTSSSTRQRRVVHMQKRTGAGKQYRLKLTQDGSAPSATTTIYFKERQLELFSLRDSNLRLGVVPMPAKVTVAVFGNDDYAKASLVRRWRGAAWRTTGCRTPPTDEVTMSADVVRVSPQSASRLHEGMDVSVLIKNYGSGFASPTEPKRAVCPDADVYVLCVGDHGHGWENAIESAKGQLQGEALPDGTDGTHRHLKTNSKAARKQAAPVLLCATDFKSAGGKMEHESRARRQQIFKAALQALVGMTGRISYRVKCQIQHDNEVEYSFFVAVMIALATKWAAAGARA